ncbi:hypothetical protein VM1G_11913 [Cytospora mali]|uniref:Uncharacterized protein n=1 Tax=Cytospora mali TaxID=578113 RepID=A0A194WB70_CYTMA|nr:hypothetical protein VM1G_11913 [Valsa mali]
MPNGPAAASISTIESILKPAEATGGQPGKAKCIECDGYDDDWSMEMQPSFLLHSETAKDEADIG